MVSVYAYSARLLLLALFLRLDVFRKLSMVFVYELNGHKQFCCELIPFDLLFIDSHARPIAALAYHRSFVDMQMLVLVEKESLSAEEQKAVVMELAREPGAGPEVNLDRGGSDGLAPRLHRPECACADEVGAESVLGAGVRVSWTPG